MDYLTASEIAKIWNISGRMVAYYCEAGRIYGAVKKGKVWFIPSDAEKPVDKRYTKRKIKISDTGAPNDIDKYDNDNLSAVYHTRDVYNNLGLTRETLRYYEDIGLINPKRSKYSQYREFDLFDMSRLMAIDFFKKRGFTPIEVKELFNASSPQEYSDILQKQIDLLSNNISDLRTMLKRLESAKTFFDYTLGQVGEFTIKELRPFRVQESIDYVTSFGEYKDKVLAYLNENEDILSNMVRAITFDETGYKTSAMYIVEPSIKEVVKDQNVFLEHGKCLYTTLISDIPDDSIMERMFALCHSWAAEHDMSFRGVVYIFIRFVMLDKQTDKYCYEVWIPLK